MAVALTMEQATGDSSDLDTSVSFAGVAFGSAVADRILFALLGVGRDHATAVITGVTIDGNAAASAGTVSQSQLVAGSFTVNRQICGFWVADAAGTSGNVVVTLSGSGTSFTAVYLSLYRITGADMTTPVVTFESAIGSAGAGSINDTITIPTDGALIAGVYDANTNGTTFTWTNATESADANAVFAYSSAHSTTPGSTTVTATSDASDPADTRPVLGLFAIQPPIVAGQPATKRMGGVKFAGNLAGQNTNMWRKSIGWRKSLSGLLLPNPSIIKV